MSLKTRAREMLDRIMNSFPESLRFDIALRYGVLSEIEAGLYVERGLCANQLESSISRWTDNSFARCLLRGEMEDMKEQGEK